ncbi:MAG TPA: hemerythrin domain-containing protein [Candidatus Binatia bacterium]|jgi:hemerythrin superfamily protein
MDALELLKQDHQAVKSLFDQIDDTENAKQRKKLFDQIDTELNIHAHIEETVFYPEMQKIDELKEMVEEALEEHQEVKTLLEQIEGLDPENEQFSASLEELMENVEHHVTEEEDEMFPKVREQCDQAMLDRLGDQLESAKGKQHKQAV